MIITTKFEVNQKVWLLRNHKAVEVIIQVIVTNSYSPNSSIIQYWVDSVNVDGNLIKEELLFKTKQDLLDSL